jgi:hypothetical protein
MQTEPVMVGPYCGALQQQQIPVPARITYQQVREEGPWVLPPYAQIYPEVAPVEEVPPAAWVPPPIKRIDIFSAQQTFPL